MIQTATKGGNYRMSVTFRMAIVEKIADPKWHKMGLDRM